MVQVQFKALYHSVPVDGSAVSSMKQAAVVWRKRRRRESAARVFTVCPSGERGRDIEES